MTTNPTQFFGLSRPKFNDNSWHDDVNGNSTTIDALFKSLGLTSVQGAWQPSTVFAVGARVIDPASGETYQNEVAHTSGVGTFAADRAANPSYWVIVETGVVVRQAFVTGTDYLVGDFVFQQAEYLGGIVTSPFTGGANLRVNIADLGVIYDIKANMATIAAAIVTAGNSATAAATSATTATTQATAATTSATNAATSATNAGTAAAAAGTSAGNAATSATGASGSATTASTAATTAGTSATNAATSATGAVASAATATTKAGEAATSAAAALANAIAIAQAAVQVGSTQEWNGPVPAGWLRFREGGTFNRATFPDLATFWDNNGAFWGMTAPQIALGQFPDTTGYVSRHAGGLGPAVGAKQEDAYQEHHHAMTDALNPTVDHNGLGVGGYISNGGALGYYPDGNVRIRPGRSIAAPGGTTPRTAAETRVKTFGVRYIIKASSAATNQGLVDMLALATQAADNTNRIAVLEAIGKPFTKEYVSAEQVITAGGLLTLTHSLGVAPKLGSVQLVCKTAEHGYVPGQSIEMGATGRMFGTESNGFTFASDAASISVKQGATGSGQLVIPVGGSIAYITAANWRLIVRAWA